jgi:cold shock CspA family protein
MNKTGKVTRLLPEKNFGFITCPGEIGDYFFHRDECQADFYELSEGDKVEFEGLTTDKGLRATGVMKL